MRQRGAARSDRGHLREHLADEILITTGAIEANFLLFNELLSAGDRIVVVSPAYQQLHSVAKAIGCEVALWKLRDDGGFRFELDDLRALATPGRG